MRTTLKLVLPLVISVALVSLLFAAYQVRSQRKNLRSDVSRRAELLADSLQESIQPLFEKNDRNSERAMQKVVDRFAQREHMKGIAVYESGGNLVVMTSTLGEAYKHAPSAASRSTQHNEGQGEFTSIADVPIFLYAMPLQRADKAAGALLVIFDTSFIDSRVLLTLRDALLTRAAGNVADQRAGAGAGALDVPGSAETNSKVAEDIAVGRNSNAGFAAAGRDFRSTK